MATLKSVMAELAAKGSEKTRRIYVRHGMPEDRILGVSMADLKAIAKTIKRDQTLALELYATGIMDAMYLAGIVADGAKMTTKQIEQWAEGAAGMPMILDYTVAWVTVEHPGVWKIATQWIKSKKEHLAEAGWSTLGGLVSITPDSALDLPAIEGLLKTAVKTIHSVPDRVRLKMNSFVIAVGCYVGPLMDRAKGAAEEIGPVSADMGDTACKIPSATAYIAKVEGMGRAGVKRKTIRC